MKLSKFCTNIAGDLVVIRPSVLLIYSYYVKGAVTGNIDIWKPLLSTVDLFRGYMRH